MTERVDREHEKTFGGREREETPGDREREETPGDREETPGGREKGKPASAPEDDHERAAEHGRRGRPDVPAALPFLVLPGRDSDVGLRPLDTVAGLHSAAITLRDASGATVDKATIGQQCIADATVRNVGAADCYSGLASFYRASPQALDSGAHAGTPPGPAFARVGFECRAGHATTVSAPPFTPQNDDDASSSILVQVLDLLADHPTRPFDAIADRHVARRDLIADFSGTWDGEITTNWPSQTGRAFMLRITIEQRALRIDCSMFGEVGSPPGLPAKPQDQGSGVLVGREATVITTETLPPQVTSPWATTTWRLTLSMPDTMQVFADKRYASGGRQEQRGTLRRTA